MFYVYIYSHNNSPFYVGKGSADRVAYHRRRKDKHPFVQKLQKLIREGTEPQVGLIAFDIELEAYEFENLLIIEIGRKDLNTGPLLNLNDGGKGGMRGYKRSAETNLKHSKTITGVKKSDSHRENIAKTKKGSLNPMKRIELRKAQSERMMGNQRRLGIL